VMEFHGLCCQPLCHRYFHLSLFFEFVAIKITLQRWQEMTTTERRIPHLHSQSVFFAYRFIKPRNPIFDWPQFVVAFATLRKASINFIMSVCPHVKTRLPLHGFSWKFIFEYFSKIYRETSSFIKI
jgi:hypothetical protein